MDITPRTTHVVHSGRYFMKTSAIRAEMNIKYACCKISGPDACIHIIPTAPKFHIIIPTVM